MNKEVIKKLLHSKNWEDRLIGLNYCKDVSYEEFISLLERVHSRETSETRIISCRWEVETNIDFHDSSLNPLEVNSEIVLSMYQAITFVYKGNPYQVVYPKKL